MGLTEPSNKIYLRVGNGRIVKTAKADTPNAVSRVNSKNETVYELIWESISGTLDAITFRDHPEYGKSWNLTIVDDQTYTLQVNEDSRYGMDLLKKIPNLHHGQWYTFKPWEMEKDGKRKSGLSIIGQGDVKVENFYQTFTEKQGGGWDIKNKPGFPDFDGDTKDKDDLKIYFVKLAKYLRSEATKHIQGNFQGAVVHAEPVVDGLPDDSSLPF